MESLSSTKIRKLLVVQKPIISNAKTNKITSFKASTKSCFFFTFNFIASDYFLYYMFTHAYGLLYFLIRTLKCFFSKITSLRPLIKIISANNSVLCTQALVLTNYMALKFTTVSKTT